MKTLTLTALGLGLALTGTAASADIVLYGHAGQSVVLDDDQYLTPLHAPRVVVLGPADAPIRMIGVDRRDSPAEVLVDAIEDMDRRHPAALWPFVRYATH